jgi:hypothetical protein
MQGAPKRQVNAEEMLAELKRVVESSTPAPNAPPPSAPTAPKSSYPGRETWRPQIDKGSDRLVKPSADRSIGPPTGLQKSTERSSRRWKLRAGGLALAVAATIGASFALMNKAQDPLEREPSVAGTEGGARPRNEQTLEPSSSPGSATPAFTPAPLNQAATLVAAHRIGPDGAPIATAPSAPGSTDSARPLSEAAKTVTPPAASQTTRPDQLSIATAPSSPASPSSTPPLAEAPITAAPSATSQAIRPDEPPIATAPSSPASPNPTPPLAAAPKTAGPSAASQAIKPDERPIATAPSAPASTHSAGLAERSKPSATPTASASNEAAEPSKPKADAKKKLPGKPSVQKSRASANASAKPTAQAERQSTEPAQPKEAERSPHPAQDTGSPAAVAPVPAPSVQQRVADGMTQAFGYLMHLPGALVPHLDGPNPDAH